MRPTAGPRRRLRSPRPKESSWCSARPEVLLHLDLPAPPARACASASSSCERCARWAALSSTWGTQRPRSIGGNPPSVVAAKQTVGPGASCQRSKVSSRSVLLDQTSLPSPFYTLLATRQALSQRVKQCGANAAARASADWAGRSAPLPSRMLGAARAMRTSGGRASAERGRRRAALPARRETEGRGAL
jgi:hypothetical protein